MDRLFIFIGVYAYIVYAATTYEPRSQSAHMLPTSVSVDHIGASMRERNQRAAVECVGTVQQRRACWAGWPVAR